MSIMGETKSKYSLTVKELASLRDSKILDLFVEVLKNKESVIPLEFENIRFMFETRFEAPLEVFGLSNNRFDTLSFKELMNLLTSQVSSEGAPSEELNKHLIKYMRVSKIARDRKMSNLKEYVKKKHNLSVSSQGVVSRKGGNSYE